MKVCVIGAGPSGLVTLKYLLNDRDVSQAVVFEASNAVGGSFVNKVYDDTYLVSSTTLTAFSDFRFKDLKARHISATKYVDYLQAYVDHFHLMQFIQLNTTVVRISQQKAISGPYTVVTHSAGVEREEIFDAVAVCSGLHNIPIMPTESSLPGLSSFRGLVLHSCAYKHRNIFRDKNVLVVGCGETAMDVAHRAAVTVGPQGSVGIVVRNGLLSIPHFLGSPDKPLDVFITNLFEHAMEHPWIHYLQLRWFISTYIIRFFLLLLGSSWGFNQWACPVDKVQRGYHIINKSHGAMAHMNAYAKRKYGPLGWLSLWIDGESTRTPITTYGGGGGGIKCIVSSPPVSSNCTAARTEEPSSTVLFDNGEKMSKCNVMVFCTGYRQRFSFLDDSFFNTSADIQTSSSSSLSKCCFHHAQGEHPLPPDHFICDSSRHPRLGFIGFVRPNVGAIPPMSEVQVMWWLQNMKGNVKHARGTGNAASYMLLGRKYQYGVDYGNYMHRLCEEMGSAPSLLQLYRGGGLRGLYAYCQGQAHVPFFRLTGPYESAQCWATVIGELYDVCVDRGLLENAGLAIMNAGFLGVNLAAYVVEFIYCNSFGLFTGRRFAGFAKYS